MTDSKSGRDRSPRRRSGAGGGGRGGGGAGKGRRAPPERRIFISNIPFEMKWQEVKDLFRDTVGDVTYVELFNDEHEKPRGCGILEFSSEELAKKAVEKMHRHEMRGRKLVVKEDFDTERDKFGRIIRGSGGDRGGDRDRGGRGDFDRRGGDVGNSGGNGPVDYGNTYGLSPQFLSSLGIEGPLHTRLFVANLAYSVEEKKLREVFRLAGRVCEVELNRDKDGKSRGHGVVEFSHPVEAVQGISMFNNQNLFDRKMIVRFDKTPGPTPEDLDELPSRLPEGLANVGMGLGTNGNPLTNVASNLPSAQNNSSNMGSGNGAGGNVGGSGNNLPADLANTMGNLQGMAALARQLNMAAGGGMNNMGGGNAGSNLAGSLMANLVGAAAQNNMGGASAGPAGGAMGGGNATGFGGAGGAGGNSLMGGAGGMGGMGGPNGNVPNIGMGGRGGSGNQGPTGFPSGGGSYGNSGGSSSLMGMPSVGGGGPSGGDNRGMNSGGGGGGGPAGNSMTSDTILVRNLPQECSWKSLREGFSHCGDIKYAEMKERGMGLIRFTNERDADRAVSMMDNQVINGRNIEVRLY